MTYTGIDEAGLGPILGPYCAGMVSIGYEEEYTDPRISCSALLTAEPKKGHLSVRDSKKIYSTGKLKELEQTVLSFYEHFTGEQPSNGQNFIKTLSGTSLEDSAPWYKKLNTLALPLCEELQGGEIGKMATRMKETLGSERLRLLTLVLTVVPAKDFNQSLLRTPNKATVCQKIVSPLLRSAVSHSDIVTVDRQGGRRYYGDWLVELFPGRLLTAQRELKDLSRYKLENCRIDFQVKADAISFETSLASMFAKYSRELCMRAFNDYWQELSGIKPTAGYYSDGQRFLKDLKDQNLLPEDLDILIRRK